MLLGIPYLTVLLTLVGLTLAVGLPALIAGFSWPAPPHGRRPAAFFGPRVTGGAW